MSGPTRANPFAAGLAEQLRREKSDRHRRAGILGGLTTARRHKGKHALWGAKAKRKEEDGKPASGPAVGKG